MDFDETLETCDVCITAVDLSLFVLFVFLHIKVLFASFVFKMKYKIF